MFAKFLCQVGQAFPADGRYVWLRLGGNMRVGEIADFSKKTCSVVEMGRFFWDLFWDVFVSIFRLQILLEKISIWNFESEGLGTACWSWSTFAGATLQVDCGGTRWKSGGVSVLLVFDWKILRKQQDKEEFRWNDEFIIFYYLFVAYHRHWHIFWTGRQEFLRGLRCAGGRTLLESHGQSLEWLKGKVLRNVTFFSWGFGSMIDFTCFYGFHPSFWGDHSTRMISKSIATHSV